MLNYRIAAAAQRDLEELVAYTAERFGELALDRYLRLLDVAIGNLRMDPQCVGVRVFSETLRSYHLSICKEQARTTMGVVKNPRHLIFFRLGQDGVLEIVRLLHDSMDFERHLP